MAFESRGENWTVGKGLGYFDRRAKNGVYEGERSIGNIANMSVSVNMDKRNHYNHKGDYRYIDKSAVVEVTPKVSLTLDEITPENFALLFLANVGEHEQAASGLETMIIDRARVRPGFVIDLGLRFIDPDTFEVADSGGDPYRAGTDYKLDPAGGRLHVFRNAGIIGADDLTVTYSLREQSCKVLNAFLRSSIEGRFTYVSDNSSGNNFIIELWHVSFTLTGAATLLTERGEMMRIGLEGEIQEDKSHPDSPFGKVTVVER